MKSTTVIPRRMLRKRHLPDPQGNCISEVPCEVEIEVDWDELAQVLGQRVIHNHGYRGQVGSFLYGLIKVKVRETD